MTDLSRIPLMIASAVILAGCSSTLIGDAPANIVVASGVEVQDISEVDRPNWMRDVPRCTRHLGTVALYESDQEMQGPFGPQNATPMLRYLLQRSGCFTVLDRSPALTKLEGEMKYGSSPAPAAAPPASPNADPNVLPDAAMPSMPMPNFRRADYLLTARVIFQEVVSNDLSIGASASAPSLPGQWNYSGSSNLSLSARRTEVNVVLFLTDMRSSVQLLTEQGSAAKLDRTSSSFGSFFTDSLNSKTQAAALYDAYARFVARLNAEPPGRAGKGGGKQKI